jgi:hypothetical protein
MLGLVNRVAWIAVALGSAVLGGAVGGVVVSRTRLVPARPVPAEDRSVASEPDELGELDRRLTAVEAALHRLDRNRALTELAASRAGDQAAPAGSAPAAAVDNPVFEEAVRDVLGRIESERNKEREARQQERRREAAERWANGMGERLRMTDAQKARVLELAREYYEKLGAMGRGDGGMEPPPREERRQRVDALRSQYDQRMGEVLDGRQMREYQALDEAERLGGSSGRRRPGD